MSLAQPSPARPVVTRCVLEPHRWKARYQRNNRQNGQKNMRCFPECGDVHRESGFCGKNQIYADVSVSAPITGLRVFGELALSEGPRWALGQVVAEEEVLVRSREALNRNLLAADAAGPDALAIAHRPARFTFNAKGLGWHYDWVSSKHSSNLLHAYTVYVLAPLALPGMSQVLGVFQSPRFAISCRRSPFDGDVNELAAPVPEHATEATLSHSLLFDPPAAFSPPLRSDGISPPSPPPAFKQARLLTGSPWAETAPALSHAIPPCSPASPPANGHPQPSAEAVLRILSAVARLDVLESFVNPPAASNNATAASAFAWLEPMTDIFSGNLELWDDPADIFDLQTLLVDPDVNRRQGVQIITSLARFLVEERSITEALLQNESTSYESFMSIIAREIESFLAANHNAMTIAELDGLLRGEDPRQVPSDLRLKDAIQNYPTEARSDSMAMLASAAFTTSATESFRACPFHLLLPSQVMRPNNGILPDGLSLTQVAHPRPMTPDMPALDLSGTWTRPDDCATDLDTWREQRGLDAITRKLLMQMDKYFRIVHTSHDALTVHLLPKLLAPGVMKVNLDAQLYDFSMPHPLGGMPMCQKFQSWACGPVWVSRYLYEQSAGERILNTLWKMPDGNLHAMRVYESNVQGESIVFPEGGVSTWKDGWRIKQIAKTMYLPVP